MFAALKPYDFPIKLVAIALSGALLVAAVMRHDAGQRQIGYNKAVKEWQIKEAEAKEEARKVEAGLRQQVEDAQHEAAQRAQQNRDLAVALERTNGGLRTALATIRNGLSFATVEACRRTADTLAVVFEDCTGRYGALAVAATGHSSDVQTLTKSWPSPK